jgi:hypothetical protein
MDMGGNVAWEVIDEDAKKATVDSEGAMGGPSQVK